MAPGSASLATAAAALPAAALPPVAVPPAVPAVLGKHSHHVAVEKKVNAWWNGFIYYLYIYIYILCIFYLLWFIELYMHGWLILICIKDYVVGGFAFVLLR